MRFASLNSLAPILWVGLTFTILIPSALARTHRPGLPRHRLALPEMHLRRPRSRIVPTRLKLRLPRKNLRYKKPNPVIRTICSSSRKWWKRSYSMPPLSMNKGTLWSDWIEAILQCSTMASQTITSFRAEDIPVAIGILVDNSGSMRDKREQIARSVVNLVDASNSKDQVFVVNFNDNPYLDQDFTGDVKLLQTALRRTSTGGSTALYDAVVASSKHLEKDAKLEKAGPACRHRWSRHEPEQTLQDALRQMQQPDGPDTLCNRASGPLDGNSRT